MADRGGLASGGGKSDGEGMAGLRRQQAGVRHRGEIQTSPRTVDSTGSPTILSSPPSDRAWKSPWLPANSCLFFGYGLKRCADHGKFPAGLGAKKINRAILSGADQRAYFGDGDKFRGGVQRCVIDSKVVVKLIELVGIGDFFGDELPVRQANQVVEGWRRFQPRDCARRFIGFVRRLEI